ncbi:unnamed protein product, partial [Allacma fusca]
MGNCFEQHWLDPGKYVIKQLSGTDPATFYFGVKFYAADPCKLFEEITSDEVVPNQTSKWVLHAV